MPFIASVGERETGWLPIPQGRFPTQARVLRAFFDDAITGALKSLASLPTFSWRPQTCNVFDQGRTPTCVAGAVSAASFIAMKAAGIVFGDGNTPPSPSLLFRGIKSRERATFLPPGAGVDIPLPPLTNTGCHSADAIALLAEEGLASMQVQQTPDGRYYDLWSADDVAGMNPLPAPNVTDNLSATELERTRTKLLSGERFLDTNAPDYTSLLRQALLLGPVTWGGTVDSQVFNYVAGAQPYGPADPTDKNSGGHCTLIMGWRESPFFPGETDWEVQGTWSKAYGEGGFSWGREAWAKTGENCLWTVKQIGRTP